MARMADEYPYPAIFFGHTHVPYARPVGETVFVNVGSGGRPKDGDWRVCYAIVDPARLGEPDFVEFVRVPYDYERLQRELAATPLITSFAGPEQGRTRHDDEGSRAGGDGRRPEPRRAGPARRRAPVRRAGPRRLPASQRRRPRIGCEQRLARVRRRRSRAVPAPAVVGAGGRRRRPVGARLPLLAAVRRLAVPRRPAPPGHPLGLRARVLRLRQRQGAAPAHHRRLRRRHRALVLQPAAHARPAARAARDDRQRDGRQPRHRHALLQLLGGAAVHRLRRGRHPARRDLLVPHRRADGQRDRPGAALRALRLGGRGPLPRHRPPHRHRRRLGHRPPAHGALRRGLGARDPHGRR